MPLMPEARQTEHFGCEHCWPATAEAAWNGRGNLTRVAELIDESHFDVALLACARCNQRFVTVFTEMIDWIDSDDPQYWTLLPLTEPEADSLLRQRDSLSDAQLNELGVGR